MSPAQAFALTEDQIMAVLRRVIDPEIGRNMVDLGLIYSVNVNPAGHVTVAMTLTTLVCPLQATFRQSVEAALWQALPDLTGVQAVVIPRSSTTTCRSGSSRVAHRPSSRSML